MILVKPQASNLLPRKRRQPLHYRGGGVIVPMTNNPLMATGTDTNNATRRSVVADRIAAMRRQEDTCYKCRDYTIRRRTSTDFGTFPNIRDNMSRSSPCTIGMSAANPASATAAATITPLPPALDQTCRAKVTTWLYQITDYVSISHENVLFAMSYLDRYLSSSSSGTTTNASNNYKDDVEHCKSDKLQYQLAAMTCLYLSIKLNEAKEMETTLLSKLSHGKYSCHDIVAMEERIVFRLKWRFSDPTVTCFVNHYMELLPLDRLCCYNNATGDGNAEDIVMEMVEKLAIVQAELSAGDLYFVPTSKSVVALACIKNAIRHVVRVSNDDADSIEMEDVLLGAIGDATCIDSSCLVVEDAMERLALLCEGNEAMRRVRSSMDVILVGAEHKQQQEEEKHSDDAPMEDIEGASNRRQHAAAVEMKLSPVCISVTATRYK